MTVSTKDQANRVKLYGVALSFLGTDASPADEAPDEVGCADTASSIIIAAFPGILKHTVSTAELFNELMACPGFKRVSDFKFGDVIISPTAVGKQPGGLTNGHVGIVGENNEVLSNSSANGLFIQNFTIDSWVARYRTIGKYPIYSFRKV